MSQIEKDLAEVKTDVKWIKSTLETHIAHHWQIKIIALTAVIGGIVSLIFGVLG